MCTGIFILKRGREVCKFQNSNVCVSEIDREGDGGIVSDDQWCLCAHFCLYELTFVFLDRV